MVSSDGLMPVSRLLRTLKNCGLWRNDPRLAETMKRIKMNVEASSEFDAQRDMWLTREMFREFVHDNSLLIQRAFAGSFVIPMFSSFCSVIDDIYWECRTYSEGKVC